MRKKKIFGQNLWAIVDFDLPEKDTSNFRGNILPFLNLPHSSRSSIVVKHPFVLRAFHYIITSYNIISTCIVRIINRNLYWNYNINYRKEIEKKFHSSTKIRWNHKPTFGVGGKHSSKCHKYRRHWWGFNIFKKKSFY